MQYCPHKKRSECSWAQDLSLEGNSSDDDVDVQGIPGEQTWTDLIMNNIIGEQAGGVKTGAQTGKEIDRATDIIVGEVITDTDDRVTDSEASKADEYPGEAETDKKAVDSNSTNMAGDEDGENRPPNIGGTNSQSGHSSNSNGTNGRREVIMVYKKNGVKVKRLTSMEPVQVRTFLHQVEVAEKRPAHICCSTYRR